MKDVVTALAIEEKPKIDTHRKRLYRTTCSTCTRLRTGS